MGWEGKKKLLLCSRRQALISFCVLVEFNYNIGTSNYLVDNSVIT